MGEQRDARLDATQDAGDVVAFLPQERTLGSRRSRSVGPCHETAAVKRRQFIAALAAWSVTARAQPRRRVVGMLDTSARPLNPNFDALVEGLRKHGHVEGENLAFAYRSADGRNDRFPTLAGELVDLGVDVIVTRGTPAALAARAATTATPIPVVMAAAGDPETIARNPAKPALNLTGFGAYARGIEAKRVALMRDLLPRIERVAGLMNLSNPSRQAEWREVEAALTASGIAAQVLDARSAADIAPAFEAATRLSADGLVVGSDTVMQANQTQVVALAARHRLPAIYTFRDFVEAGGLISYGVSLPDLYRRAADYVDRILAGAKPDELPIAQPTGFELAISLPAAAAIGMTVPPALLARADAVIR
jgi:putative tryptophan/tyrosine transport system substrate-binding protein